MKLLLLPLFLVLMQLTSFQQKDTTKANDEITWISWDEVQTKMKAEPRKIVVFVTTDWAGWGKRMDITTWKDPKVGKLIAEKFYAIYMNAETKEDITIGEKMYRFIANGRRGYHELAAAILDGKMSYPATAFFNDQLQKLVNVSGFRGVEEMQLLLAYFGDDHYLTVPWDSYYNSHKKVE